MSRDQLIDLITREVLRVVKDGPAGAPAASSGPAIAGGRAVPSGPPPPAPSGLGQEPLVVVCGNPLGLKDVQETIPKLRQKCPRLRAVLSGAASELFATSRRVFAGITVSAFDPEFVTGIRRITSVTVLNASVNTVAKLAMLVADTQPTAAIFLALREKIPVRLVTDPLTPWFLNPAISRKIQAYLEDLRAMGLETVTLASLLDAPEGPATHAAAVPAGSGPLPDAKTECGACGWAGHCASLCSDRVSAVMETGAVRVAARPGMKIAGGEINRMIDHTLLKADATETDVKRLCDEAGANRFMSVCVNPSWVPLAKRLLSGTGVKVCTVVGFPLGATSSHAKEAETREAVRGGADEIDMVINVGALKAGHHALVLDDVRGVVRGAQGRIVKVILETALLDDDQKRKACELSRDAGADFVKTSTGFGPGGATVEDVTLMRQVVGPRMGVKASGGVRDLDTARRMIAAGANRIGASASVAIAQKARESRTDGVREDTARATTSMPGNPAPGIAPTRKTPT